MGGEGGARESRDDLEEMDGEISTVHPHEINIWISGVRSSVCAANQWHA